MDSGQIILFQAREARRRLKFGLQMNLYGLLPTRWRNCLNLHLIKLCNIKHLTYEQEVNTVLQ